MRGDLRKLLQHFGEHFRTRDSRSRRVRAATAGSMQKAAAQAGSSERKEQREQGSCTHGAASRGLSLCMATPLLHAALEVIVCFAAMVHAIAAPLRPVLCGSVGETAAGESKWASKLGDACALRRVCWRVCAGVCAHLALPASRHSPYRVGARATRTCLPGKRSL